MTHQPTAFEIERAVPADDALKDLLLPPPETIPANPPAPAARQKFNFRKMLLTSAAAAVLAGAVWYGWDYWTVGQYLVSTDDAYVKADNTTIAPKVSGYLREVLVGDNERVTTGEVLARIDERDFQVALDQARSDVAAAEVLAVRLVHAAERVIAIGFEVDRQRQALGFKEDAREVLAGQECGMAFENYQDMRAGDVIECYRVETVQRSL